MIAGSSGALIPPARAAPWLQAEIARVKPWIASTVVMGTQVPCMPAPRPQMLARLMACIRVQVMATRRGVRVVPDESMTRPTAWGSLSRMGRGLGGAARTAAIQARVSVIRRGPGLAVPAPGRSWISRTSASGSLNGLVGMRRRARAAIST